MDKALISEIVSAIVSDVVETLPREIYKFYQKPPGRRPSDLSKRISNVVSGLSEQSAIEVIQDVVDRTVFSLLYLVDSEFKDHAISTSFKKHDEAEAVLAQQLVERYRSMVDPGGLVV